MMEGDEEFNLSHVRFVVANDILLVDIDSNYHVCLVVDKDCNND